MLATVVLIIARNGGWGDTEPDKEYRQHSEYHPSCPRPRGSKVRHWDDRLARHGRIHSHEQT